LRVRQQRQTREAIRRQAVRQERQAHGEAIGVRAPPPPPPAPARSLWDEFKGSRREPVEEVSPLYPGVAGSRRRY
jgi:hypothetical protein